MMSNEQESSSTPFAAWASSNREPASVTLSTGYQQGPSLHSHIASVADGHIKVRLLHGLDRAQRHAILATATYRYFTHETVVTHQDDPADRLFLLLRGSARFFFLTPTGKKVYLHWLSPGEIFGAASLLTETANFIVSTEVSKGTHTLVWQKNVLRSLIRVYPLLLENSLAVACDYLVWYLASHLSLVSCSARDRLAHVLVSLASGIGQPSSNGTRIEITNEQLANTANVTLFTASRLLREFHRSGAILKTRGQVVISRQDRLFPNRREIESRRA